MAAAASKSLANAAQVPCFSQKLSQVAQLAAWIALQPLSAPHDPQYLRM